jgi:elongation factor Ts
MLELNCETDFVAKGERFVALAEELLAHLPKCTVCFTRSIFDINYG